MKYVWMNEEVFEFAKEGSLVEVPYVEPSFLEIIDVKSMIHRSHGIWTNDILNVFRKMFCVHYDIYDDACYSHSMTFLIQIWQVSWLS